MISNRIASLKTSWILLNRPFRLIYLREAKKKWWGYGLGGREAVGVGAGRGRKRRYQKTPKYTNPTIPQLQLHRRTYHCACLLLSIAAYYFSASLVER